MLISVCIINHNYERFVGEAVTSAIEQAGPAAEVVVVDDGSTDGSLAALEAFGERITVVAKPNGGQGSAMNAGFAASQGHVVLFLDADDLLGPEALRQVRDRFTANPGLAKVAIRMRKVDVSGVPTGALEPSAAWVLPRGDLRRHVLRRRSYVWPASSGNAYSRAALARVLPMPEEPFRVEADLYLATTVPLCGPVDAIDEPLVDYRIHGSNSYAGTNVDGAFFRRKLDRIEVAHRAVVELAGDEASRTPTAEQVADPAYAAYRLGSVLLDPGAHPHQADRWRPLAVRAAALAATHPGHPRTARLKRAAWALTMAVAPRRAAVRLVPLRFR